MTEFFVGEKKDAIIGAYDYLEHLIHNVKEIATVEGRWFPNKYFYKFYFEDGNLYMYQYTEDKTVNRLFKFGCVADFIRFIIKRLMLAGCLYDEDIDRVLSQKFLGSWEADDKTKYALYMDEQIHAWGPDNFYIVKRDEIIHIYRVNAYYCLLKLAELYLW